MGCGALIVATDDHGDWDPALFTTVYKTVEGHQSVPRAELTLPAYLLPKLGHARSILIVTDNEPFFLNATVPTRLTKALGGDNADLWHQWTSAIESCPTGVTIAHIRSHALDDDSEKSRALLKQSIQRRRYRAPVHRSPTQQLLDEAARQRHRAQHNGLLHSVGNAVADKAATTTQKHALPNESIADEFEKIAAYTGCIAKRIATIEAYCRHTDAHTQSKLSTVPTAPAFPATYAATADSITESGHSIYHQGDWLRCHRCNAKARTHAFAALLSRPCIPHTPITSHTPTLDHTGNPPDATDCDDVRPQTAMSAEAHPNLQTFHTSHAHSDATVAPEGPPPTPQLCDICHAEQACSRCVKCERFVCTSSQCACDGAMRCGTCRYQANHTVDAALTLDADHCRNVDAAFQRIRAARSRSAPPATPMAHLDCSDHPSHTTTLTTGATVPPLAPWGDEDAPADTPSEGALEEGGHPDASQRRRQPVHIRARIIRLNRSARASRKRQIEQDSARAITMLTRASHANTATAPTAGIGRGHLPFTIGPILFCKICGATKSRSQGSRLARPCRGWAPPGTRTAIKYRMRGQTYAFYRNVVSNNQGRVAPVPTAYLPATTTGRPMPTVPTPPPTPPRRPIRLTRINVLNAHLPLPHHPPGEPAAVSQVSVQSSCASPRCAARCSAWRATAC